MKMNKTLFNLIATCLVLVLQLGTSAQASGPVIPPTFYPPPAPTSITVPASSTGDFNVSWVATTASYYTLEEKFGSGDWVTISGIQDPAVTTKSLISKPGGVYTYRVAACDYVGGCSAFVTSSTTNVIQPYPPAASLSVQASYTYAVRSGDFDNNGYIDLLVDRLTGGQIDGSMQSYVVFQYPNGEVAAAKPSSTVLNYARTFAESTVVNLMPNDANADGYADHSIENLKAVLGAAVGDDMIVFAPGTELDKTSPSGDVVIDDNFMTFFNDLGQWANSSSYFADNIQTYTVPQFAIGYVCTLSFGGSEGWTPGVQGFFPTTICFPVVYVVGYRTVQYGVNFTALSASASIEPMLNDMGNLSDAELLVLSDYIKTVIGVNSFGFDDSGVRRDTNYDGEDHPEERRKAFQNFIRFVANFSKNEVTAEPSSTKTHDYHNETVICSPSPENASWCTISNLACWLRKFPAPFYDNDEHDVEVQNGDFRDLDPFGTDPIRIGVGTAAGLPATAIGNVTRDGHTFHDPVNPADCPRPVSGGLDGPNWKTSPWNGCSQVLRQPVAVGDTIVIRTRGYGDNRFPGLNDAVGPYIFEDLDEFMLETILADSDKLCP